FTCSCPDWAVMCKHVAAVLYGVGARLDNDPMLFFHLRGIDVEHFIDVTLANKVEAMLANIDKPSSRIIEGDVSELFGV
ncbi:MAG: SWIM zinc finger family protein, partial [Lachnospiraceae bacterium]|nr:SWIM zinc finger family protein [Lachnospiraceae bacterium]